jgi:hypothetical protein
LVAFPLKVLLLPLGGLHRTLLILLAQLLPIFLLTLQPQ